MSVKSFALPVYNPGLLLTPTCQLAAGTRDWLTEIGDPTIIGIAAQEALARAVIRAVSAAKRGHLSLYRLGEERLCCWFLMSVTPTLFSEYTGARS
ncbi:MAG: hypothetical protein ACM3NT_07305 [Methylocystaceae bacterium]